MKKPYIKKIGKIGGFDVWYVDGKYIRENIDEEFTNFSANYLFNFIPKNEFWIDCEFGKTKEWKYFTTFLLTRDKWIKRGKSILEARDHGTIAEKDKRNKSPIIKKFKKLDNSEIIIKIRRKLLKKYSNEKIKVYVADGFLVRSLFFIDFTEGGHDMIYHFIPPGEIWIDDALSPKELEYVLLHEAHERRLMKKGFTYEKAHYRSSKIELYCRKNPGKVSKILAKELEKQN
ncbi:Uncharacterised protein [uncultured archaeon]|nr:Uncharacterised protein [uncultured archaeon]